MSLVNLTINGKSVTVENETTILAAAKKLNILGIHGTVGIEVQVNEANNRAYIQLGYADM